MSEWRSRNQDAKLHESGAERPGVKFFYPPKVDGFWMFLIPKHNPKGLTHVQLTTQHEAIAVPRRWVAHRGHFGVVEAFVGASGSVLMALWRWRKEAIVPKRIIDQSGSRWFFDQSQLSEWQRVQFSHSSPCSKKMQNLTPGKETKGYPLVI